MLWLQHETSGWRKWITLLQKMNCSAWKYWRSADLLVGAHQGCFVTFGDSVKCFSIALRLFVEFVESCLNILHQTNWKLTERDGDNIKGFAARLRHLEIPRTLWRCAVLARVKGAGLQPNRWGISFWCSWRSEEHPKPLSASSKTTLDEKSFRLMIFRSSAGIL